MIYPSEDQLNKIESKYKLIAIVATRSKQLKAGMKPLIETDSTNPITIAFEEVAAGVITANITDIDELDLDYTEFTRTSAIYDIDNNLSDEDREEELNSVIEQNMYPQIIEKSDKSEIAENIKASAGNLDDINENDDLILDKDNIEQEEE